MNVKGPPLLAITGGARGGTARAPPRAWPRAYDRTGCPRRPRATCFPHRHRRLASSACSCGNVILRDAQPAAARGGNQGGTRRLRDEVSTASRRAPDDGREIPAAADACRCRLARAVFDGVPRTARAVLLALVGSAVLTLSARLSIPFWPVPMTLQSLAVLLIGAGFGLRLGAATVVLYLIEGAIGLPVFAGTPMHGLGLAYMMGPTGGYLDRFPGRRGNRRVLRRTRVRTGRCRSFSGR